MNKRLRNSTSASLLPNGLLAEVPVRIQRSRQHKQVSPNGLQIVYVGRGSRWGNPFRVVKYKHGGWAVKCSGEENEIDILVKNCKPFYPTKEEAVEAAICCYDFWLLPYKHGDNMMAFYHAMANVDDVIMSLKGKNLSCWCNLDEKCHADLLLELANR